MLLFTLSGVSKRPQNDNADLPCPQWAPSKGRVLTAVFKRTGASGHMVKTTAVSRHGVRMGNENDSSVRTGNKYDGSVMTQPQDT
jgi:hypothetical protein